MTRHRGTQWRAALYRAAFLEGGLALPGRRRDGDGINPRWGPPQARPRESRVTCL
jgi:hypothetical protein